MSLNYPWLEPYQKSVTKIIKQGRLPHALLLTGKTGSGKADFADFLARLLLCEQPVKDTSPCGRCKACTLFNAGSHPDFHYVSFVEDEKTGKLKKSIVVDQVRELATKLSMKSHAGGYKVAVITPAGAMNINAANSLLKTLEEPSDNTILVLVSDQPGRLPATVRSRCQQLSIEIQDREVALQWLSGQPDTRDAEKYLQLADNAPLEALKLAQGNAIEARGKHFSELVDILDGRVSPLAVAVDWSKDEELQAVRWLRDWLMDLLRIRMTGQTGSVRSMDLVEGLEALSGRLDSRQLFEQLDRINRSLQLTASGLNRQLMTEEILLAWETRH